MSIAIARSSYHLRAKYCIEEFREDQAFVPVYRYGSSFVTGTQVPSLQLVVPKVPVLVLRVVPFTGMSTGTNSRAAQLYKYW